MPHPDPKLNEREDSPATEHQPAGDLLFDPEAADRNKLHKDDPSISTDAPFEENSATEGEGQ